jgi:alanine racemase
MSRQTSSKPSSTDTAALEAMINLGAIAHNVGVLRERCAPEVMAVVKADGYGHGAVPVARAALGAGAIEIGVATIAEALELRRGGVEAPLIAWLHTLSADFGAAVRADVEVVVSSARQLSTVVAAAHAVGRPATVGVKIDTGLGRSGIAPDEWENTRDALAKYVAEQSITFRTAMCHLARGDEPNHPFNDEQASRMDNCVRDLERVGVAPQRVHIANSAAALTRPDLSREMVRTGIAIYGRTPVPAAGDFGLTPAMTLTAEVALVKKVAAGQGISYNHTWVAPSDTVVAVLPCGYADGVPRVLSNQLEVWLGGRRFRNVGRVCMDQLVVDLGPDGGGVAEGDRAVLFGTGAHGEPTALEWADAAGTIDYEILTSIRGRRVRRYVGG